MTVHQHTSEENLLQPTKMCSLKNGLWLLKYVESLTKKNVIKLSLTLLTPQIKEER